MTLIGIILALIGIVGFILNYTGITKLEGVLGDLRVWGALAVVGAVTAILTRRPSD